MFDKYLDVHRKLWPKDYVDLLDKTNRICRLKQKKPLCISGYVDIRAVGPIQTLLDPSSDVLWG